MTMVVNNYLNESHPHPKVVELITLGFTSKLLQWWNNCLTERSREDIKNAIQKDKEGTPIFGERIGRGILNGVNTLIYMIMKHFVGKPSNITSRIYDQLSNLRCKTLGDYQWYEDVFTTRVMHRSDCNSPLWKEKFINGLPKLFGKKVKETLCNPLVVIDYNNLTYGDISSTIRSEGMKMCRGMKIQSQVRSRKLLYIVWFTSHPRENLNTKRKVLLKNSIGKEQHPNIIENRSTTTSKIMISIRKERNPNPQVNMEIPYQKHPNNALIVEKVVISEKSVEIRLNPLSTPLLVTKLVKKRSLNSLNLTTLKVSHPAVPTTMRSTN